MPGPSDTPERELGVRRRRRFVDGPARAVSSAYGLGIVIGTALLMLPAARTGSSNASFMESLFTATSALCVTGLSTVDPSTYWTPFGQTIILLLIQVGGLGIMTLASLLGILVAKRLGLRSMLTAASESNTLDIGDLRGVLIGVVKVSALIETVVAVILTARFWLGYGESFGHALWLGVFHAVSGFNNAGFALWSDSLVGFGDDPWILLPLCFAVITGGLGLPVLIELIKLRRPRRWSLHVKLTLWGSAGLLLVGFALLAGLEWGNAATLGDKPAGERLLIAFTQSVMPRSAGFNAWEYADVHQSSLFVTSILNFIGGGSASTAGGIKVGTFILLFFVMMAEFRGSRDVEIVGRRIGERTLRQAVTVTFAAMTLVLTSTVLLLILEPLSLGPALFETTSAFSTTGLSAGVTGTLGVPAQVVLILLMFVGRIGPMTLVAALAMRERPHLYRYPEGRPLIG